jgi:hypothetical protein
MKKDYNELTMTFREVSERYPKIAELIAEHSGKKAERLADAGERFCVIVFPTRRDYIVMQMKSRIVSFISAWGYDFGEVPDAGMPSFEKMAASVTDDMVSAAAERYISSKCWMTSDGYGNVCTCYTDGNAVIRVDEGKIADI